MGVLLGIQPSPNMWILCSYGGHSRLGMKKFGKLWHWWSSQIQKQQPHVSPKWRNFKNSVGQSPIIWHGRSHGIVPSSPLMKCGDIALYCYYWASKRCHGSILLRSMCTILELTIHHFVACKWLPQFLVKQFIRAPLHRPPQERKTSNTLVKHFVHINHIHLKHAKWCDIIIYMYVYISCYVSQVWNKRFGRFGFSIGAQLSDKASILDNHTMAAGKRKKQHRVPSLRSYNYWPMAPWWMLDVHGLEAVFVCVLSTGERWNMPHLMELQTWCCAIRFVIRIYNA